MFDGLSEKLRDIINKTHSKELTADNMRDALREIRRALLDADVNLRVVKAFISAIKDKAEGENVIQGVNPSQQLVKIVYDELVELLGKKNKTLDFSGHPNIIMLLGLQGTGKTTSCAKLALKLKNDGRNPLLVACDIYRPAAITQLQTLGKEINIEVFTLGNCSDVRQIVSSAKDYALSNGFNTIILDTAGRLQIDTDMMAELLLIDRIFNPNEKLLVIDSMMGQEAVNTAENFDAQLGLTGLILTKLDGDSRGGAALSVAYCTGKPVKLTGTGEKLNALEDFYPDRLASRILGMGDIVSLVERAQEVFDEKQALELQEKMLKSSFTFEDFLKLQKQMKMFGSMEQIIGMLPGINISKDDRQKLSYEGEKQFKKTEVIIQSMTPEERRNPALMNTGRKKRLAKGTGLDLREINTFITQFDQMRIMMKGMSGIKNLLGKPGGMQNLPAELSGFKGKMGKHAVNKAMSMMRKFK